MTDQPTRINPFEGWTTVDDAARIVKRDRGTILNWARRGYIACHRVGPKIELVNLEEVKAFSDTRPILNRKTSLTKSR